MANKNERENRNRTWGGTAILLLVALLAVYAGGCQAAPVSQAAGGNRNEQTLTASGTIRVDELRIASELGGRILNIAVAAGDRVQVGDLLVTLDGTPIELQLMSAEAAVVTAQADLEVLRAGPRAEEITAARAALEAAKARRDGAYTAWQNALDMLENPQELEAQIIAARKQVALAEQAVELAEAQLANERMLRDLKAKGTSERRMADLQVYAAEKALAAAQADEQAARAALNHLLGMRNEPLALTTQANTAEGQYRIAEAEVKAAQAQLDDLLDGPTAEEIAVAEAAVRQAEAEAQVLREQLARYTLVSPIEGVVLVQVLRAGELAAPAAPILTLGDLSQVRLEVYVPENRVGHVYVGQPVKVTVDSFPDRVFEGQVTRIGSEPEFTPRNVATAEERLNTFYAVEILLPNPEGLLKPGMPADASFGE